MTLPVPPYSCQEHQGGGLATPIRKLETKLNAVGTRRVKIIEEGGLTLESILVKKNPLGDSKCADASCNICTYQGSKGNCKMRSVIYTNTCGNVDVMIW